MSPAPEKWRQTTQADNSEFSTKIIIRGPANVVGKLYGRDASWVQLNSFVDKPTGAISHWVVYDELYDSKGARRWQSATTDKAVSLKTVPLRLKVSSCGRGTCIYDESVGAVIPNDVFAEAAIKQLKVKFSGGDGDQYIAYIESDQVRDQINAAEFYSAQQLKK